MKCNDSQAAKTAFKFAFPKTICKYQECFSVLCLNSQNEPIGKPVRISQGTVTGVEVHPRDVFRIAVKRNATSIIIAHNHPSGSIVPSNSDIILTRRLKNAGDLLGIPILDHLILTTDENKYYSFLDNRGTLEL